MENSWKVTIPTTLLCTYTTSSTGPLYHSVQMAYSICTNGKVAHSILVCPLVPISSLHRVVEQLGSSQGS
ncbi:hypothetical protein F8388_008655 [Cannabis sativa]|uniref:Uncharacterized protein n=1 Tax=Cannabis sativa TaxID=3483 RepID=A0A7J6GJ49_CANSA|nr:hypothetical protein F8388_008655 [Cannabis sativa]